MKVVLYDLKLRNLNRDQAAKTMYTLLNDLKVFVSERAISIKLDQDEKNRHLWQLLIYHLKPGMFVRALDLIVKNKIYPVMGDFKQ